MARLSWAAFWRMAMLMALGLVAFAGGTVAVQAPGLALIVAAALFLRKGRRWVNTRSLGNARFCSVDELLRRGMLGEDGLILGRVGGCERPTVSQAVRTIFSPSVSAELACEMCVAAILSPRRMRNRLIRLRNFIHLNTVAPAGSGKSVSVLIPNLLSYRGSCVVIDPKGELYAATAAHRREKFGHKIIRLDSFDLHGPGADSFNVLDFIGPDDDDLVEQCRDVANQLVVRQGTEHEPHWNDTAENVIASFIYLICKCESNPQHRNLQTLRDLVSSKEKYELAIWLMKQHVGDEMLQRLGGSVSWLQDRELQGVMATVQRHTQWADSPKVAAGMTRSTFDPRVLRSGNATVYLILPHDKLVVLESLLRMWIGGLLRVLTRRGADESNPVLFLVDEAAHLGRIRALEAAVTLYRGMGIRLWFFWQSLDQMKACFGDNANVVLGNLHTQLFFGINDYETADAISRKVGEQTVLTFSQNRTRSTSQPTGQIGPQNHPGSVSSSTSTTSTETARRLLKPEEILGMSESVALVVHKNMPVIPAWKVYHYADAEFRRGGTGRQRGLGLAAAAAAACLLLFGMIAFAVVRSLPRLQTEGPGSAWLQAWTGRDGDGQVVTARHAAGPVRRTTQRAQARRPRTEFSKLIPIR